MINRSGLTPGATIYIRFWKNYSTSGGLFDLCVYDPPPPINDDCSAAISIPVDTICTYSTYTTIGATASPGTTWCGSYTGGDVWFKVVVPASGRLIFDSQDYTVVNAGMEIYSGSCGALTYIACDASSSVNNPGMPMIYKTGLTPGSTIYIRFWKSNSVIGGAFALCVYEPPLLINDECSGAITIIPDTVCSYTLYSNLFETASAGVPPPGCANYIGGDVWFKTIVPASGHLIFDTQNGSITDGGMAIYSGNCGSLILIACDDNSSNNVLMPKINQSGLTPGSTIYIRLWKNNNIVGGTFSLCVYYPPIPINDECSAAIPIPVDTICSYSTYSNLGATSSIGVPAPGCANYIGGDVWFSVVVPASGHLAFDSYSLGIGNAGMAIYSGNCGSLTLIMCDDNSSINYLMPMINQSGLNPGSTIFIRFWQNNSVAGGLFKLCVFEPHGPINDDCFGAIAIVADTICSYTTYSTTGATATSGVPPPGCASYIGGDVWFSVVVPSSGHLIFDTQSLVLGNNGGMAIYSGSCGSLTLIACDDNSSYSSQLMPLINKYGLTPGSIIYIRFWGNNTLNGISFGLCVFSPPIPINDECSGAIALSEDTLCNYVTYTNMGATASAGIPAPGCASYIGGDVWFSAVVPPSGTLIIHSQNEGIGNGGMAIYSGNCNSLTLIECNDNYGSNLVPGYFMPVIYHTGLVPGSTIYIRFWQNNNLLGGKFGLCVYYPPPTPVQAPCTNLGFENGFSGWYGTTGNSVAGITNAPIPEYEPLVFNNTLDPNLTLMTGGTDPYGGFPVVHEGSMSLKIGNSATDQTYNAASIEQTFLVTNANTNFTYYYAVVLQTGGHAFNIQPFFQIELFNPNGYLIPCGIYSVALPNVDFIQSASPSIYYKPWTPISVNLSAYLGQNVKIRFTSSDCVPGAHFGYAYIDCSCQPYQLISPGNICQGESATLSAPVGALSYFWAPGGDTTSTITVNPSTTTNYSCLIASQGNTPCYYTLTSQVIVYPAPPVVAGSNSPVCSGQPLYLTSNSPTANSLSWSGSNGFISLDPNPIITSSSPADNGVYTVTANYLNGCTRSDNISISVQQPSNILQVPVICQGESFSVGLHNYNLSGIYFDTLTTSIGCDSILITYLTVDTIHYINFNPNICQGEVFSVGLHNYISSGIYLDTLNSLYGCDSIITTHLIVNPSFQANLNPTICQGQSFMVGIHNYSQTGIYYDTLSTHLGCDSIFITNLIVGAIQQDTINPIICQGETFTMGTHNYSIPGTYHDTLSSIFGCDSIITILLTVQPKQQVTLNPNICIGDTFYVGIHYYTTTGSYTDTIVTALGCDSIVLTNLVVSPFPSAPVITQVGNVLSSNAPAGNQWYNQFGIIVGATNQTYTATVDGDYYDIVTLNGCVSDTSNIRHVMIFIIHVVNTGIEENENIDGINIYPNPVLDELIIEAKGNKKKIEFEIMNSIGQIVFKGSFVERTVVQTKNFAQGMYMIKLGTGERFEFRKLVKE
ncbi:MAG: T9SS type A sorting domain-containing protein [Bacteroidota bacterium]